MKNESRSEEVRKAIHAALGVGSKDGAVDEVLRALDKQKVFRYHNDDVISLLSTAGRILVVLIDDQTMTQRAISVYLDLSETMIDKTVKSLIAAGLVTKTKVNRQNVYKINKENVMKHPDIRKFYDAIITLSGNPHDEEEPF